MVTRQRSFHKPNGSLEARKKAKGSFGENSASFEDVKPFRAKGRWKTKSMKQLYAEVPRRVERNAQGRKEVRKLRRKLATMKIPMTVSREGNPKKDSSSRRPRCAVWPSEKNPSPRYRYDGSIRE